MERSARITWFVGDDLFARTILYYLVERLLNSDGIELNLNQKFHSKIFISYSLNLKAKYANDISV